MSGDIRKRFGTRVKELRQATGLSQEAFADRCGFARSYMSRIERGGANPSLDAIEVLAVALEVQAGSLFEFIDGLQEQHVPYVADGSCFNPALLRPSTRMYAVGEKGAGNTLYFEDYEQALAYLRTMSPAKWWRPNAKGQWGLVTAVRWGLPPGAPDQG